MKSRAGIITGLLISIIIILSARVGIGFFNTLENKILDFRFLIRGKTNPGNEVVIIAIDEKTLDELGRWPFPRNYIVRVVENLNRAGIKALGFDMVFSEPDIYSGISTVDYIETEMETKRMMTPEMLKFFNDTRLNLDNDYHLSQELKNTPKAILGYFFHRNKKEISHLDARTIEERIKSIEKSKFRVAYFESTNPNKDFFRSGLVPEPNIGVISNVATGFGYFNVFPDGDGTIRWTPLTMVCNDLFYPSLALEMARAYLDAPSPDIYISDDGAYKIVIGDIEIPTNSRGEMLINYRGGVRTFPYYSFTDVFNNRIPAEYFKDKIAIIGTVAVGTYDLRVTPMGSDFPGMEINATIIDNILHRDFLSMPGWVHYVNLLVILLIGLILGLIIPRVSALFGVLIATGFSASWIGFAEYMFRAQHTWVMIFPPLLTIALVSSALMLTRYIMVEVSGRRIRNAFQFYVPEAVVSEIIKNPSMLTLGGERKEVSILFSDVQGFTSLSEQLPPEQLIIILNEYLTAMTDVVFKNRGLLDKYIGDAIMAVFGAPLPQPDHPKRACYTAIDMKSELLNLHKKWEAENKPKLKIRIGINTGYAAVGNMGSKKRFDYTVMGDNVNLSSRLENLNKIYGTTIIISEYTHNHVRDEIACRELDMVRVRGKNIPVKIYEIIGRKGEFPEEEEFARAFERGLSAVRKGNWKEALSIFEEIKKAHPGDATTELYIQRIGAMITDPLPSDWDGVFK